MSNARENVNLLTSADWDVSTLRLANWGSGAVPAQVILKTNYVAGDGGGLFRYDASDTTTADNGGTVIVDAAGNRWKRNYAGALELVWFGLGRTRTATQNVTAWNAARDVLNAQGGGIMVWPSTIMAGDFAAGQSIDINSTLDALGYNFIQQQFPGVGFGARAACRIRWTGSAGGTMFRNGSQSATTPSYGGGIYGGVLFDGANTAGTAVELNGCQNWRVDKLFVERFTSGTAVIFSSVDGHDFTHNIFTNIDINVSGSAVGLKWTQYTNGRNVCHNYFTFLRIFASNGIAFDQGGSDTNYGVKIQVYRNGGGTDGRWVVRDATSGATDIDYCYDNTWEQVYSTVPIDHEYVGRGSEGNQYLYLIFTSGSAAPTWDAGSAGYWGAPDGETYRVQADETKEYHAPDGNIAFGYNASRPDGARISITHPTGQIERWRSDAPGANAKIWGHEINSSGFLQLNTINDNNTFGAEAERWERSGSTPTQKKFFYPVVHTNLGLKALDTNASHSLIIKPNSDITAERTFSVTTGDADRELQLLNTSFTPTFTCDTPGDLSISYATQLGRYQRIGKLVFFQIELEFTPTYTTATGEWYVEGLPFVIEDTGLDPAFSFARSQNVVPPTNGTVPGAHGGSFAPNAGRIRFIWCLTTGGTTAPSITTNIPSGASPLLFLSGFYFTSAA